MSTLLIAILITSIFMLWYYSRRISPYKPLGTEESLDPVLTHNSLKIYSNNNTASGKSVVFKNPADRYEPGSGYGGLRKDIPDQVQTVPDHVYLPHKNLYRDNTQPKLLTKRVKLPLYRQEPGVYSINIPAHLERKNIYTVTENGVQYQVYGFGKIYITNGKYAVMNLNHYVIMNTKIPENGVLPAGKGHIMPTSNLIHANYQLYVTGEDQPKPTAEIDVVYISVIDRNVGPFQRKSAKFVYDGKTYLISNGKVIRTE